MAFRVLVLVLVLPCLLACASGCGSDEKANPKFQKGAEMKVDPAIKDAKKAANPPVSQ